MKSSMFVRSEIMSHRSLMKAWRLMIPTVLMLTMVAVQAKEAGFSDSGQLLFEFNRAKEALHEIPVSSTNMPPVEIRGRITNQDGEPLQNASVLIAGTQTGTVTDANGYYILNSPDNRNLVLEISSVGYQTKRVNVGNQTEINVILESEVTSLDQVVVIGYGTAKKKDLTGSISHIDAKVFENQSMAQFTNMLAGTTSGLQVTQGASASGGGSLLIRGRKSLSGGTSPLIVVDGAIFDGSIKDINPNDIENIDVMKDASSAAVYGASAAGGVILVTTKKGNTGKPVIGVNSKVGIATTTHDLKPFGPEDYFNMHRDFWTEVNSRSGSGGRPLGYYYNPNELPAGVSLEQWRSMSNTSGLSDEDIWLSRLSAFPIEIENYKAGKTTDFYNLVIRPAVQQDYSLSIGGGTKDVKYYMSVQYLNNKGIIKGDEFKAIRLRMNLDLRVTDWLHVGTNTQFGSRDESVVPGNVDLVGVQSPYGSMWNPDGTLNRYTNDYVGTLNPLENYYYQNRLNISNTLFSNLYANVKLPLGIDYKLSYQPGLGFASDYNYWGPNSTVGGVSHVGGYATRDDGRSFGWRLDNILSWNKTSGINKIDVTLLATSELHKGWASRQENSTFAPSGNLGFNALQFGSSPAVRDNDSWSSGNSYMGRLNYTLLDKYLVTASVRRDGYSAFGQKNPQATFPALALAWVISNEAFFNVSAIDFLKLRLSRGMNGNRNIGIYASLATLGSILDYDEGVRTGVYNSTLANPDLRWEKTLSNDIGLDMELFQSRLALSIDAYVSKTTDLLMNRQLPIITGFSSITTNLGQLNNRGLNISVNTVNVKNKNFEWESSLVFSLNRNKIVKLFGDMGTYKLLGQTHTGELPDFTNGWFPGQASDVVWNYNVLGVWQTGEKDGAVVYGLAPGDWKVKDVNDDKKLLQFDDKQFIGHTIPQYNIGFRNEFTILKNLYASVFLRADLGFIRSIPRLTTNNSVLDRQNIWSWPYWSLNNPSNEFARYIFPDNLGQYEGGITIYKKTSFVRVQDISLSYSFTQNWIHRVRLRDLRVFGAINNFLTFTKWPGFDPESGMTPMPRVFTIGVNASL